MIESDPVLMSLEQRIERLEESVASLQESRPLAIPQANTCAAPPVEDAAPGPDRLNSHVPSRTPWLIADILRESPATVREARRGHEPDPVAAAVLALLGGADGITVHLREDRRHIQERDVRLLRPVVPNRLNLEMAAVDSIVQIACDIKPDEATLVPE